MLSSTPSRWLLLAGLAALPLLLAGCIVPAEDDSTPDGGDGSSNGATNHAPQADAGEDQSVVAGAAVTLSGIGSTDPDGDALSYTWNQVSGNPAVSLDQVFSSIARFQAPEDVSAATTLTFSLTVSDGLASSVDTVVVTIAPAD